MHFTERLPSSYITYSTQEHYLALSILANALFASRRTQESLSCK